MKKDAMLPALLGLAALFPRQRQQQKTEPEKPPTSSQTKRFKHTKTRRRIARLSRRKNR